MPRPNSDITETRFALRMPRNMREAIHEQAELEGISAASWVRSLVFDNLDTYLVRKHEVEKPAEMALPVADPKEEATA